MRLPFLVPPLVYACLALVRRVYDRELDSLTFTLIPISTEQQEQVQKEGEEREVSQHTIPTTVPTITTAVTTAVTSTTLRFSSLQLLQFILELITLFSTGHNSDLSISLSLQAALAADECRHSIITYEFIQAAFLIYESDITNSQTQVRVLISLISTVTYCKHILYDDYEGLTTKIAQYANKLLRKADQSRCITLTTHVFIGTSDERALECLQRALKVSKSESICAGVYVCRILCVNIAELYATYCTYYTYYSYYVYYMSGGLQLRSVTVCRHTRTVRNTYTYKYIRTTTVLCIHTIHTFLFTLYSRLIQHITVLICIYICTTHVYLDMYTPTRQATL